MPNGKRKFLCNLFWSTKHQYTNETRVFFFFQTKSSVTKSAYYNLIYYIASLQILTTLSRLYDMYRLSTREETFLLELEISRQGRCLFSIPTFKHFYQTNKSGCGNLKQRHK